MNLGQKHTKNGRPMVYKQTGLPVYDKSLYRRTNEVKQQLTKGLDSKDAHWLLIQGEVRNKIGFR